MTTTTKQKTNTLKVTNVFKRNLWALNRRMYFVDLIEELEESYVCKVFRYNEKKETYNYYVSDEFPKKLFKYEVKKEYHDEDVSGYLSFNQVNINKGRIVPISDCILNRYKYINNTGSSRSSKTYSIIDVCDWYARSNHNKRLTAWRDTKKSCKDTVLKDFLKRLKTTSRFERKRFNKTESTYTYGIEGNDQETFFEIHGGDDEETVHGLTQDLAWLNEPYKISQDTFDQIDQRTSDFLIFDLNPKENHWSDTVSKDWRCLTIHSTFKDNPFCPSEQRRKILSYQPPEMAQVVIDGKLSKDDAYTYDLKLNKLLFSKTELNELARCRKNKKNGTASIYKWSVYGLGLKAEKPDRIYTNWTKISYEEFLNLDYPEFYGLDFGQTNPTALVHIKYNDGKFYVHELLYKPEKEMSIGLVNEIKQVIDDKATPIYCDDASPEKWKELRQAGFNARPAKKGKIIDGISLIQKCQIIYTDISENLEKEYEEYEWDSDRMGLIDKPVMVNDHLLDGFRYACINARRKLKIVVE